MSVPSGPFQYPVSLIGGQTGGSPFVSCGWVTGQQANIVTGLDVWYNSAYLRAVQVTYSDASRSNIFGSASDNHTSFNFAAGDPVTSMTLWGNGVGTRTGRIRLTTRDKTLDVGKDTSGQTAYNIDIGSGVLVGMMGRSGLDVDQLGAIFLRSAIAQVAISNVVYTPSIAGTVTGIQPLDIDDAEFANPANATRPLNWNFGGSASRMATTTFTQASGNVYGETVGVEVSAQGFGIGAKVSSGYQWQQQQTNTTSTSVSTTITFTWGLNGTLDPGQTCEVDAISQIGNASTSYNSTVTVTLDDGSTNTFAERGTFRTIAYTQVTLQVSQGRYNTTENGKAPVLNT